MCEIMDVIYEYFAFGVVGLLCPVNLTYGLLIIEVQNLINLVSSGCM